MFNGAEGYKKKWQDQLFSVLKEARGKGKKLTDRHAKPIFKRGKSKNQILSL